jgi:formyltetrahydrofolate-dependent phosphoribosylglycinamide formyltransferase
MHNVKIAVLLSGGGRTLQNIIDYIKAGKLTAEVVVVIGSRPDAYGLERARKEKIETVCIAYKEYKEKACPDKDEFSKAINEQLDRCQIDLIVMAGFMHLFRADEKWNGRIMNIHPALIPAFCGKGYYGHHVHEAVLEYGAKVSGCTVHFTDRAYDKGPIILQSAVPVQDDDTPDTLAARVFQEECKLYPRAIQLFADGKLEIKGRRVIIKN